MREKFPTSVRVVRTFELPGTSKETEFIEKGGGGRERRRRRANERLVIEACPRRMKLNEEAPYIRKFP